MAKPILRRNETRIRRAIRNGETVRSQGPDALFLRCNSQTDHQPARGSTARHAKSHRAKRQPRGIPIAPVARFGPRGEKREPGAHLQPDLGFQQLALVEGWKSVNTDPTNFSAHRFLADSYSILPRHEIARVSELLQSQLLQPLNTTPIQPRLAESNLFLISASGPAALGFNEFNPLFNRNGINFQTTGLTGENHTYSGEGVLSGIYKKTSFSLGGFHFRTDGWRENADQKDTISNAFVQLELSPQTSVQTEYRHRNTQTGELRLRFEPDDFIPNRRHQDETHSTRLGFHHAFTSDSRLVGNFAYSNGDRRVVHAPRRANDADVRGEDEAFGGELQHLFRSSPISVISGIGHVKIKSDDILTLRFSFFGQEFVQRVSSDLDVQHSNFYLYSYASLRDNVILTLGGSGDFFANDRPGSAPIKQFNPKIGITWNPLADTTVRAAAFRVLKRTLALNQTLEPTQVAGFNQFFDDFNGTKSWRYGAAVDQKFTRSLFGGIEYSYRDLRVPFLASVSNALDEEVVDWQENLFRSYLFWTPHDWIALNAGYSWERLVRARRFDDGAKNVETQRVPLGLSFFHPSGVSASLKANYTTQRGDFRRLGTTSYRAATDSFWTVDAAFSFRLPQRYGFITVGATNLFDKKFKHFDTDQGAVNINPRIIPDRVVFGRITLALP